MLKQVWAHRSWWRYRSGMPLVASACGLVRIPDRRTRDRRLAEIAPQAERQIQVLGLLLSLEAVTDATMAASAGSAFATPGSIWHKQAQAAGIIPEGLHGLAVEADWIQADYHGWVYGYKAHVSISVAPTTVRVVLAACVTGRACESQVRQARVKDLPPLLRTLLLAAGSDAGEGLQRAPNGALQAWHLCPSRLANRRLMPGATAPLIWPRPKAKPAIGSVAPALSHSLALSRISFRSIRCPFKAKPMHLSSSYWLDMPGT